MFYFKNFNLVCFIFLYINGFKSECSNEEKVLFDFTNFDNPSYWTEQSDTVRDVGMSKAVLLLHETKKFKIGLMYFLLIPQSDGSGFAGMRILKYINLCHYTKIVLILRGQGENYNYKVVLRHQNKNNEPYPTYEEYFKVPTNKQFVQVILKLEDFKPYFRGQLVSDAEPLDQCNITAFGLQVYGGIYSDIKQKGTSSLEIIQIKAIN